MRGAHRWNVWKKLTIQNIADMADVSKSTVSRYLNEGYISEEKAERVKRVIAETGFKSNFFAKRLKMKQSKLIGIVLPRMDSVTVGKLLTGINRVLEPAGYQGLLLVSQLKKKKELANIVSLQRQGVDGIIIDSIGITPEHLQLTQSLKLPLVFTGQQHPAVHYVKLNDRGAGAMMGTISARRDITGSCLRGSRKRIRPWGRTGGRVLSRLSSRTIRALR